MEETYPYEGRSLLRRFISTKEAHFLRRGLIFTEDVHFNGGDSFPQRTHFLRRRLIPTKALVFAE